MTIPLAVPAAQALPALPAVPALPGIPGVDLAGTLKELIGQAVHSFAAGVFADLSDALLATTAVPLDGPLDAPWRAMLAVAGLFAVPILLAGVTSEVLAGRPAQAAKRGVLLPLLIGPLLLAARAVLTLLNSLVEGACGLLVTVGLGGPEGFAEGIDKMRQTLGVAAGPADPTGVGASLAVVLAAGVLAFIIWVELAFRAALLLLLAAFVPLALAGLFWSATARWTRRLLESLAAVLLAGVTSEVLAGRPAQAAKRGVLLPLLIGPLLLAARAVLTLLNSLVDGACGLLVTVGLGGPQGFAEGIDQMRQTLGVAAGPADPTGVGASLAVVLAAGVLAFIIWVELAFRAALLLLLAAFVPLALAGLFWSATARWTRRLLESLAAVLLAPVVITMVMVLATATLTAPTTGAAQGIDHTAIALALLFLGTLGLPMTFRLVPLVVEAAVVAGTGASVTRSARRTAQHSARRLAAAAPGAGAAARFATAMPPAAHPSGPSIAPATAPQMPPPPPVPPVAAGAGAGGQS